MKELQSWSNSALNDAGGLCLNEIFEYQADLNPNQLALVFQDEELTYKELDDKANQLAHYLRSIGAGPGQLVAIYLNRSLQAVVSILAVLKTGAGYVPIDSAFPQDRMSHIIADANINIVITEQSLLEKAMEVHRKQTVVIDWLEHIRDISHCTRRRLNRFETKVSPEDLCYIIYTSGSTGRPKGIMTEHQNTVSFVNSFKKTCQLNSADRVYHGFSLSFDGSVEEMWMAFSNGATLIVGPQDIGKLANETADYINNNGVTVFSTVPTFLSMIPKDLPTVRLLILSGEQCSQEIVNKWANRRRRLLNVYGPTETTVNATAKDCQPFHPVTIGKALDNYVLYILNEKMEQMPKGECGELYIAGPGLARGYLNLEETTNKSFIVSPFGTNGDRLYKTGDLVKENEHNELVFLGRIDTQVKVRGNRVELSEIEAVLLEYHPIQAAVVKVYESENGQELAAYVIKKEDDTSFNQNDILNLLTDRLPVYMIPSYLDVILDFPLLSSGKADRKNLPIPSNLLIRTNRKIIAPQTEGEVTLQRLWEGFFKINPISIDDDFFTDLGGYSLLAARLATIIRRDLGCNIAIRDIYKYSSIRKMANYLNEVLHSGNQSLKTLPNNVQNKTAKDIFEELSKKFYPFCVSLQMLSSYFIYAVITIPAVIGFLIFTKIYSSNGYSSSMIFMLLGLVCFFHLAIIAFSVLMKWLLIGQYKPGKYPLWGFYYFRWWLADRLQAINGIAIFTGTPIINLYYRAMGANIGSNCIIDTPLCSTFDLLKIGNNTSICSETQVSGYRIEDGFLVLGNVNIGNNCFIGIHSAVGINCQMEDGAKLGDLSLLADNRVLQANKSYLGAPAEEAEIILPEQNRVVKKRHPIIFGFLFLLLAIISFVFYLIASIPASILLFKAYFSASIIYYAVAIFLSIPLEVVMLCLGFAAIKKVLLGRVSPGVYSIESFFYLRKWFIDNLLRQLTSTFLKPVYTTIYLPTWLRLLGAKIGYWAEISTVSQISPELMELGDGSFFADGSIIGGRHFYNGKMHISESKIGRGSFIGNSAIVPIGASIGDNCLIGCLSTPPHSLAQTPNGTEWLGSPPFNLPFRQKVLGMSRESTYNPTPKLIVQRLIVDALRIVLPGYLGFVGVAAYSIAMYFTYMNMDVFYFILLSPVYLMLTMHLEFLLVVLSKKIIMGTFKPEIKPLWCPYVWFNEVLNGIYEALGSNILIALLGTPLSVIYLRLLGCKIGKYVYLNTTLFSEFDLVKIGDYAALNSGVVVQNHLFEDRIFKSSYLVIGENCSVGNMSVILYDTIMGNAANVGPLSLLMKGETLAPDSRWIGIPTRQV